MPFKFRLKKARRYNVSSKNSYVVCVHLLDNTLIECTLTSESSGRECLDNIAQRIELSQVESFGLRYMNRRLEQRWVELDKPLRRQLDKYAKSPLLYLGVMCYAMDAQRIADEMTRYQYYLQLKADVIDGKLSCTAPQAVLLASYSVQAEFGDHNYGQHTSEYLKDFMLLPRNMTSDDATLVTLTNEIVSTHRGLTGMAPAVAELQYIILAQQLEGYGLEYYPAKDEQGNDLLLGASFIGVFVKHMNGQPTVYFKWADISNLSHNRKTFTIETSLQSIQFLADDPDMAKYIFKMCSLQHKFYRTNQFSQDSSAAQNEASLDCGQNGAIPDIQLSGQTSQMDVVDAAAAPDKQVEEMAGPVQSSRTPYQETRPAEPSAAALPVEPPPSPDGDVVYSVPAPAPGALGVGASDASLFLPAYRCSPSYDALMARRGLQLAEVYARAGALACSQPEIRAPRTPHTPPSYAQYMHRRAVDRTCSLIIYPTFSTPAGAGDEVDGAGGASAPLLSAAAPQPAHLAYPPFTCSTPDLARGVTPDPRLVSQSRFDQSVENLALDAHRLLLGQRAAAAVGKRGGGGGGGGGDDGSVTSDGRHSPSLHREYLITDPPNVDAPAPDYAYVVTPALPYSGGSGSGVTQGAALAPDLGDPAQPSLAAPANGRVGMGPLQVAAPNGLSQSSGSGLDFPEIPNQSPKDERIRSLESRLLSGQVFSEFEGVPKCRTRWSCDVAEHERNAARNRFRDVLPYDDNRVRLASSGVNPAGYINASHVHMTIASEEWRYLVAQAPLPNTVEDFWQMVWGQQVHLIAMLTAVNEGGKVKCEQYWPRLPGVDNKLTFGEFQISLQFSSSSSSYTTSGLCVRRTPGVGGRGPGEGAGGEGAGGEGERLVWHLQYTGWPDHGCPEDAADFLAYLDEIESVRRHVAMECGGDPRPIPTLVHCSAGVGRSGVVILSEVIKACLEHNQDINVPGMLQTMRDQRMHLVQTISQYRFIYQILVQYLSRSRLI